MIKPLFKGKPVCYLALRDCTAASGIVTYYGPDLTRARQACLPEPGGTVDPTGKRVCIESARSLETPRVGQRAYFEGNQAWTVARLADRVPHL